MTTSLGPPANPPVEWQPRMWQGCDLFAWMRLLLRNQFAVHLRYAYIAVVITITSIMHTVLRIIHDAWFGSRIARTRLLHPPVFIIGHWRTGTTLLHELLILDPRHNYPTTYQCIVPHHFLLTEWLFSRIFWFLVPSRRPMDNMPAGWNRPQEDEFALCMLGQPSPYLTIAFPNHPPQDQEAFDLEEMSPAARRSWAATFVGFLRRITYRDPRRLILKSPTHSCRIPTLLELFPNAHFVHIVRDPYVVFSSTVNLWKTLYQTHGMQVPDCKGLEDYVFNTFTHLYERLEEGKRLIPGGQFHELHYEDLIQNPIDEIRKIYETLGLDGFESMLPRLGDYFQTNTRYETNRYRPLDPGLREEITRRWEPVIRRYGYERREQPFNSLQSEQSAAS